MESGQHESGTVAGGDEPKGWWIDELDESVLANNKVIDRILGCLYGNCLGDAVGLGT
jgi:hypothetical protein